MAAIGGEEQRMLTLKNQPNRGIHNKQYPFDLSSPDPRPWSIELTQIRVYPTLLIKKSIVCLVLENEKDISTLFHRLNRRRIEG